MNDVVIRNGWVIDGTGAPGKRADVVVSDGVITEIGPGCGGHEGIDAEGLVVAPGFVDIHTHYDAQLTWDPAATPSLLHGVTTVIGGNCGFSLAPTNSDAAEYIVPMLAKVEGMPEDALREGLSIGWRTFGEYLDGFEGKLSINAGFLVGHSAVRRLVMGDAAVGATATPEQLERMKESVAESIRAGAIGFSTSRAASHVDHNGDPVPSRAATLDEVFALCHTVGDEPGTSLEAIPTNDQVFSPEAQLYLVGMSLAARRPVNWNSLTLEQDDVARASRLAASDMAAAAGGRVVALAPAEPRSSRYSLDEPFLWESLPGWSETMHLPLAERLEAFKDPAVRAKLRDGAATTPRRFVNWPGYAVGDVESPELDHLVGRTIADLAAEWGTSPFDALCDVAVADGLHAGLMVPDFGMDDAGWARRVELCRDRRVVIGASDAGAHIDMISAFGMYTGFLGEAVRRRELLPMEEAIHLLTDVPARLYGLVGRGRLAEGAHADIVLLDPSTVGHGPVVPRADLPSGAVRRHSDPTGIVRVLVNGVSVVENGVPTGATSGQVVRSGRDTKTPSLAIGG